MPQLSPIVIGVAFVIAAIMLIVMVRTLHAHSVHRWLLPYLAQIPGRRRRRAGEQIHILLCIADHFEPRNNIVSADTALARVHQWVELYPKLFKDFRDSDGRPPRHTFFYPLEQYDAAEMDALAALCRRGFGEVEVHLHHEHDTADALRQRLLAHKELLAHRHGLLARDRTTGEICYGFVHGNWALCNSRPDGGWCGVNDELTVLRETGCYADFTLPSAPDSSQTRQINSIYYAHSDATRPKSHDRGISVGTPPAPPNSLMLIQGPLVLDWRRRKWHVLPGIENGCLQATLPPTWHRLQLWLKAAVQVPTRPDWFFVKLHTHGGPEANQRVLLGEPMIEFHRYLARLARNAPNVKYHYVTAREMYNLARAAEARWTGSVEAARDFELRWPEERSSGVVAFNDAAAVAAG